MTDRDRWIVRNAALAIAGLMVVSVLGGCVPYRYSQPNGGYYSQPNGGYYSQPDGGYRNQSGRYAPSRNDVRPFPDRLQQGSYH